MKHEAGAHAIRIAIVEDYAEAAQTMARYLRKTPDCSARIFPRSSEFLRALEPDQFDIVITDLRMPEADGLAVLKHVRKVSPDTDVVIVSGHAEKQDAIAALKHGAYDFLEKPVVQAELVATIQRTIRYRALERERNDLARQVKTLSRRETERWGIETLIGRSKAMRRVIRDIRSLQKAYATPVFICGESGTGKELVARAIHYGGVRGKGMFVPVNCAAIPPELAESALFGHCKGAFTGAATDSKGAFEHADKGTLFLDEIGDMPLPVQAKLLRVLEDGIVVPVGAVNKGRKVDVRVLSATNADIAAKIRNRTFRADLYYRLTGFRIQLPVLRARREDIPDLTDHFCRLLAKEMGRPIPTIAPAAMARLQDHAYPGNARELKNLLERAMLESDSDEIHEGHLHFLETPDEPHEETAGHSEPNRPLTEATLPLNMARAEEAVIRNAMAQADGNISAAARLLGMTRSKLYRKLERMKP